MKLNSFLLLFNIVFFCVFIECQQIKKAAAFYPPRTDPHPQTGHTWICREFIETVKLKNGSTKERPPGCKSEIPGIYLYFSNYLVGLNGKLFPYVLDYIGKSDVKMGNRIRDHIEDKFDPRSILCYMGFKKDSFAHNYETGSVEASLLSNFVALNNAADNMGYHSGIQIEYGTNGLPYDIMATLYEMDLVKHPGDPPKKYVEGNKDAVVKYFGGDLIPEKEFYPDPKPKSKSNKMIEEIEENPANDTLQYPFFQGVPYKDYRVLKTEDFEKSCEKDESPHFSYGDGKKHSKWKRVAIVAGGVAIAGAAAVGGAIAGAAESAATAVGGEIANGARAVGHGIENKAKSGYRAWKDGADEIWEKAHPKLK